MKIDVFANPTTNELAIHIDGEMVYGITKSTPLELPITVEIHQPPVTTEDPTPPTTSASTKKK